MDTSLNITTKGLSGIEFQMDNGAGHSISYLVSAYSIGKLYDTIGGYMDWYKTWHELIDYYGKERVVKAMYAYSEVADFARILKRSGIRLDSFWSTPPPP